MTDHRVDDRRYHEVARDALYAAADRHTGRVAARLASQANEHDCWAVALAEELVVPVSPIPETAYRPAVPVPAVRRVA